MPQHKSGRNKRGANKARRANEETRKARRKDPANMYAVVTECLGNRRFRVLCWEDKAIRTMHLPGSFSRRERVGKGDIVEVSLREYHNKSSTSKDKSLCDTVYLYSSSEMEDIRSRERLTQEFLTGGADALDALRSTIAADNGDAFSFSDI